MKKDTLLTLLLLPGLTLLAGCPVIEDEDDETHTPEDFDYDPGTLTAYLTLPLPTLEPEYPPAGTAEYAVLDTLPPGLTLAPTTGVVSGTPTGPASSGTFAVEARSSNGDVLGTAEFELDLLEPAPPEISYPGAPFVLEQGEHMSVTPTIQGIVDSFSISPALPGAISFKPLTGIVSGTSGQVLAYTEYEVEATNVFGTAVATFGLTITPQVDTQVYYVLGGDGTISSFKPRGTSAYPVPSAYALAEGTPVDAVGDAAGGHLFVLDDQGRIWSHAIDPASGRLAGGVEQAQVAGAYQLELSAPAGVLFALTAGVLHAYDAAPDGSLAARGTAPASSGAADLVAHPGGDYAYVADGFEQTLSVYDLSGGLVRLDGALDLGHYALRAVVHPAGELLFSASHDGRLTSVSLDPTPGLGTVAQHASSVSAIVLPSACADLALTSDGAWLFASGGADRVVHRYDVDPVSGALTLGHTVAAGDSAGELLVGRNDDGILCLDEASEELMTWSIPGMSLDGRYRTRGAPVALSSARGGLYVETTTAVVVADGTGETLTSVAWDEGADLFVLTPQAPQALADAPVAAAFHPALDVAYALDRGGNLSAFSVDPESAELAPLGTLASPASSELFELLVDPSGRFAYALERTGEVRTFALGPDGVPTSLAGETQPVASARCATLDPLGRYLCIGSELPAQLTLLELDPVTGSPSPVAQLSTAAPIASVAFPGTGRRLFAAEAGTGALAVFDVLPVVGQLVPATPAAHALGAGDGLVVAETFGATLHFGDLAAQGLETVQLDLWDDTVTTSTDPQTPTAGPLLALVRRSSLGFFALTLEDGVARVDAYGSTAFAQPFTVGSAIFPFGSVDLAANVVYE